MEKFDKYVLTYITVVSILALSVIFVLAASY